MKGNYRLIMGKNSIREVLKQSPDRIDRLYTTKGNKDPLLLQVQKLGIDVSFLTKDQLSEMVNSSNHQLVVAALKQLSAPSLQDFLDQQEKRDASLVVMLDSIFDPHNLGAILRAAECFGVDGVIYSKNRGGSLTPVVSKVSSGASELVPLVKVSNLAETARSFQKEGFSVVAADAGPGSCSIDEFRFKEKTLLILGSEGEGIQQLLKKRADSIVRVPMHGVIDSLNVSQAAAVFLYCYRSQVQVFS